MNIAVVVGHVTGTPLERPAPLAAEDASVIVSFDVKPIAGDTGGPAVPCSWHGLAGNAPELAPGSPVTVIGRVRRHFYRRGSATTSRTDVLAERVILGPPSRSKRARHKMATTLGS